MVHASEKSIKDLGEKADKSEVEKVNDAVNKLKETLKTDEVEKIKEDTMKLTEAAGKIAEQVYKEQAANTEQTASSEASSNEVDSSKDNVVDADFTEVKEEKEENKKANQ